MTVEASDMPVAVAFRGDDGGSYYFSGFSFRRHVKADGQICNPGEH
jgi:hypothetical protein